MILKKIEYWLYVVHRCCVANAKLTLSLTFVVSSVLGWFASSVPILVSIDDLIGENFESSDTLEFLYENYSEKNDLFVVVSRHGKQRFSPGQACEIRNWLAKESERNPFIVTTYSSFSLPKPANLSKSDVFETVFSKDCTKWTRQSLDVAFSMIRASPWNGIFISKNENDIFFSFYLRPGNQNNLTGQFTPGVVSEIIESFNQAIKTRHPDIEASWSGMGAFQHHVYKSLKENPYFNLAIIVVVVLMMKMIFGTFSSGVLLSITFIFCLLFTYGFMGALGYPVDVLSSNVFLMIVLSTIQDFIFLGYLSIKFTDSDEAFRSLLLPSLLTSVTTLVGFLSLYPSDLEIISRFGVLAGIGSIVEWVCIFIIVPCLMKYFQYFRNWYCHDIVRPGSWGNRIHGIVPNKWATVLFLTPMLLSPWALQHIQFKDAPEDLFPSSHPFAQTYENVFASRQIKSVLNIIFEPGKENLATEVHKQISAFSYVTKVENPIQIKEYLFSKINSQSRTLVEEKILESEAMARYYSPKGSMRSIVYVSTSSIEVINDLKTRVINICGDNCFVTGSTVAYAEFGDKVRGTLYESLAMCVILVSSLILALGYFLQVKNYGLYWLSALWGPSVVICLVSVLQLPIYFASCLFGATLIGLTGDNAIQYLLGAHRDGEEQSLNKLGGASFYTMATMVLFALCFLFTPFYPPRILGLILASGFILSFIGDFWFLKGLLRFSRQ